MSTIINFFLPILNKNLMDYGFVNKKFNLIVYYSILILFSVITDEVFKLFQAKLILNVNNLYNYKLTSQAIRKILKIKISYLDDKNFTEIMNNLNMDINNIVSITDRQFIFRILSIFQIIGGLVGLLVINSKLAIILLLLIPLKYYAAVIFTKKKKHYVEDYMNNSRKYYTWYGDRMAGLKQTRIYSIESIIKRQFTKLQRSIIKTKYKMQLLDNLNKIFDSLLIIIITILIYLLGGYMLVQNQFTVGGIFAFYTYSLKIIRPLYLLINIKYDLTEILLSSKRFFDFLDIDEEKNHIEYFSDLKGKINGKIEFKNVYFSYDDRKNLLKNISFIINPGEKVGIVGSNGSGKSTLINIIMKLYNFDQGQVFIDDININNIKIKKLRKSICLVTQDIHLFNTEILNNLTLFQNIEESKIKKCLEISGANEFINKLPKGLDTIIGNEGNKLSGGEKQKLAIARSLISEGDIFILDEFTSNLDIKSELKINKTFLQKFSNKTIIFITHRKDILSKLDKIILLDDGKVSGIGRHSYLFENNELYKKILKYSFK